MNQNKYMLFQEDGRDITKEPNDDGHDVCDIFYKLEHVIWLDT